MPSSTWATVSQASTAASSDSKMSFQRITSIGSMPVANRDATPPRTLSVEPVDDVVGDPIALLLAEEQVAGELGALGEVGEHVAQQQARPLHVAARLLEKLEEDLVDSAFEERHRVAQPIRAIA